MLDYFDKLRRVRFRAYKTLFKQGDGELNPSAEIVMADLKKFCRADRSTFVAGDPYSSALLEGRREVFLRICSYLNLIEQDFYSLTEVKDNGRSSTNTGHTSQSDHFGFD